MMPATPSPETVIVHKRYNSQTGVFVGWDVTVDGERTSTVWTSLTDLQDVLVQVGLQYPDRNVMYEEAEL